MTFLKACLALLAHMEVGEDVPPAKLKSKYYVMLRGVRVTVKNERRKWCLYRKQPLFL